MPAGHPAWGTAVPLTAGPGWRVCVGDEEGYVGGGGAGGWQFGPPLRTTGARGGGGGGGGGSLQFSPPLRTTVTRARVVLGTGGEKGSEEPGKAWGGVSSTTQ